MRVKTSPRQHQVDQNNADQSFRCNGITDYAARISKSQPCLRFLNGELEIIMEPFFMNKQESGPGIDEALDLAIPTRSRCKHESYAPCFRLAEADFTEKQQQQLEAIDLSIKERKSCFIEDTRPRRELKATFLYKMLTDSTFLETLRSSKTSASWSCQYCKKKFAKEEDLEDHLNVLKDESNQVACCACGKTFAQKRYLRYHQRCHSERNKFTCNICTKNYSRLDNLTRHNTFHTNPDKFPCTSCERTFARKDLLKKHIKCHENRHRHHCSTCDKFFKGPLSLENHRKIFHTSDISMFV